MRASIKGTLDARSNGDAAAGVSRHCHGHCHLENVSVLPVPVYGTIWILVLAFIARYLPYGIRFSHSALLSLHKELEEGAMASGASWFQMVRHVVVPLIMPACSPAGSIFF